MAARAKRKQIAFDLDTAALKTYYPTNHWQNAYDDIKRHMLKNDFQWQQGSVYVSKRPMDIYKVNAVLSTLTARRPWLNVCMRDCMVTNIEREHSLNHLFDKDANIPKRDDKETRGHTIDDCEKRIEEMRDVEKGATPDEQRTPPDKGERGR